MLGPKEKMGYTGFREEQMEVMGVKLNSFMP